MEYNFSNATEQLEALKNFINDAGQWRYEYETEHKDAGNNYLEAYFSGRDGEYKVEEFMRASKDRYNETLKEVIEHHLNRGISKKAIIDEILNIIYAEPSGLNREYNAISQISIGEIEEQISGISGKVNGKETNDILKELTEDLSPEALKGISRDVEYYWEPIRNIDLIYINTGNDGWAFKVDYDELDERLGELKPDNRSPVEPIFLKNKKKNPHPYYKMDNPQGGKIQSILFSKTGKDAWTKKEAAGWLSKHNLNHSKVDIEENWYRFRQVDPGEFKRMKRQKNKDIKAPLFKKYSGIDVVWGYYK